jgi:AHBA synthesis associated protein
MISTTAATYRVPVIFDLDGVLLDSWHVAQQAFEHAFRVHLPHGVPPVDAFRGMLGAPFAQILEALGLPPGLRPHFENFSRGLASQIQPFPGIHELLSELVARGHPLAVLTGKSAIRTHELLRITGLAGYFGAVVTPDDAPGKPDPEGPRRCLELLNVPPTPAFLVGDALYDMLAARNAGLIPIFARWGALHPLSVDLYQHAADRPYQILPLVEA